MLEIDRKSFRERERQRRKEIAEIIEEFFGEILWSEGRKMNRNWNLPVFCHNLCSAFASRKKNYLRKAQWILR